MNTHQQTTDTSEMFNFGNGPEPAKRHPNGGGWVACTATVSETAFIGLNAEVSGDAEVGSTPTVITGLAYSITLTETHAS